MDWGIISMDIVLDLIKGRECKEEAINSKEIIRLTGYTGADVRMFINSLRQKGYPICSCKWGYYYSEDKEEIYNTILSLSSRTRSINEAIDGLNELLLIKIKEEEEKKENEFKGCSN